MTPLLWALWYHSGSDGKSRFSAVQKVHFRATNPYIAMPGGDCTTGDGSRLGDQSV